MQGDCYVVELQQIQLPDFKITQEGPPAHAEIWQFSIDQLTYLQCFGSGSAFDGRLDPDLEGLERKKKNGAKRQVIRHK
jgi:hypothetical protein